MANNERYITISPRDFIFPPFVTCPKCGNESFGILTIGSHSYSRRCKECLHPTPPKASAYFPLPKVRKKVIYLDQFAISNMMKVLNPKTKAHQLQKVDKYWLELFERLDTLCKMQLIVCPHFSCREHESRLSPFYESLRKMYQLLSHGVRFYDAETIRRFQICEHAENWAQGKENIRIDLDARRVTNDNIDAWQERFTISVNQEWPGDWIDEFRNHRQRAHHGMSKVFTRWQAETSRTFEDWFEEESMGFGRSIIKQIQNQTLEYEQILSGATKPTVDVVLPSEGVVLLSSIKMSLRDRGIPECDLWAKTFEYLLCNRMQEVPFNKISSMLFAAIARKAASGQKKPPNQGMANDIEAISVLLPYCDAMFIDNECRAYLNEKPLIDAIDYGTDIFCLNTKEKFLDYLNTIRSCVSDEHLRAVREVYGTDWEQPYTSLYR